jgi:hypothetical protein
MVFYFAVFGGGWKGISSSYLLCLLVNFIYFNNKQSIYFFVSKLYIIKKQLFQKK